MVGPDQFVPRRRRRAFGRNRDVIGAANSGAMSPPRRHIALVAHDNKKAELLNWAAFNRGTLSKHVLYATGTTSGHCFAWPPYGTSGWRAT